MDAMAAFPKSGDKPIFFRVASLAIFKGSTAAAGPARKRAAQNTNKVMFWRAAMAGAAVAGAFPALGGVWEGEREGGATRGKSTFSGVRTSTAGGSRHKSEFLKHQADCRFSSRRRQDLRRTAGHRTPNTESIVDCRFSSRRRHQNRHCILDLTYTGREALGPCGSAGAVHCTSGASLRSQGHAFRRARRVSRGGLSHCGPRRFWARTRTERAIGWVAGRAAMRIRAEQGIGGGPPFQTTVPALSLTLPPQLHAFPHHVQPLHRRHRRGRAR